MGAALDAADAALEQRRREAIGVAALAGAGRAGQQVGVAGRIERRLEQPLGLGLGRQAGQVERHSATTSRTRASTSRGGPEASIVRTRSGNRSAASAKPRATSA